MNAVNSPPALRLEAQGPGEASPIRDDRLLEGAPRPRGRHRCTEAFVEPGGFRGEWCNLTPARRHDGNLLLKEST